MKYETNQHFTYKHTGLVIKAKSMFDEPIRVGLIRFADLYDHRQPEAPQPERRDPQSHLRDSSATQEQPWEFDASHQPLLVIYTSTRDA